MPDNARLLRLQQELEQRWKPVEAAPSIARSTGGLIVLFAVVTLAIPAIIGSAGFHLLKPGQAALYYGIIAAAVLVLAPAVVRRFRPGSLIRMNAGVIALIAAAVLTAWVCFLFPSLDVRHFSAGVRCLVTGTISGVIAAVFFALILRRGFAPNPLNAAAATGFFSGLCGVFVLAIHCPVLTAPHILAWHVTVLLVTSVAGAAIGWGLARVR